MLSFVQMMFDAGCDIKPYLDCGAITQAEYDAMTLKQTNASIDAATVIANAGTEANHA